MMYFIKLKGVLYFNILILFTISIRCNFIADSTNLSSNTFERDRSIIVKNRSDTLYLFYPNKGREINFYGTRSFSHKVTVNGTDLLRADTIDSIYTRIKINRDTFLVSGDSILGEARFHLSDIRLNSNWDAVLKYFTDSTIPSIAGKILADFLDSVQLDSLIEIDSAYKLTLSNKTAVINALNNIVVTDTFFYLYKTKLEKLIWDSAFTVDINELVSENIMDTNGVLTGTLNFFQKEQLKRFNFNVFAKYIDNNFDEPIFRQFPVLGRVYTIQTLQGSTLNSLTEIFRRFLIVNDTAISHLFTIENNVMYTELKNTNLFKYNFRSEIPWNIILLLSRSDIPIIPPNELSNIIHPGKVIIFFDSLVGHSENAKKYYRLKAQYPLSGTIPFDDELRYEISGAIFIEAGFYNRSFGSSNYSIENDKGYFRYMDVKINIQAKNNKQKIINIKEKRHLITDNF